MTRAPLPDDLLTNSQVSELLANAGEESKPPLSKAYRRASRRALLWPEEASSLYQTGPSLTELPGLRAMVLTAYRLGFRMSELKNLLVLQVAGGWIVLFAGATKNSRARKVPMPTDVREAVEACCVEKQPEEHVFTWANGKPILDFRAAWAKTCKAAGAPGLRFHDLRRSATRNIIRKGVAATVAMRITGHLTRAVFDAYDVTADQDLLNTAERI
jgi:integrase